MVHLRSGETLRRYLRPGLEDGKTFVFWGRNYDANAIPGPTRDRTWVNQPDKMYHSKTKPVDTPGSDRGHRRHLRGHPAGPGRGPGGRGHRRGIRSTGQSLLDDVPRGRPGKGYAGTYATQENFRLMRAALDDVSRELGRYVRLTNYASGLCMPEIASLAGLERLDMMLNDSMYGILFRDINPQEEIHRPAVRPPDPRPGRDHHQHRRGQLPDHRRRG